MSASLSNEVDYEIVRSRRATADIVVERDGRVMVRAPRKLTEARIKAIVKAKEPWIFKTLAEWRELNSVRVRRELKNGEGFFYLGCSYCLSLLSAQTEPLILKNGRFCLRRGIVESGDVASARRHFVEFYKERGLERIKPRVQHFAPKVGVQVARVAVRDLGHRWASCSPKGNLAFHWKCVMAPLKIIDYIIVHELCHIHHLDHTDVFWNEVDKVMPDHRERHDWLRKNGASLDL